MEEKQPFPKRMVVLLSEEDEDDSVESWGE